MHGISEGPADARLPHFQGHVWTVARIVVFAAYSLGMLGEGQKHAENQGLRPRSSLSSQYNTGVQLKLLSVPEELHLACFLAYASCCRSRLAW
jgi:hypothetical protein